MENPIISGAICIDQNADYPWPGYLSKAEVFGTLFMGDRFEEKYIIYKIYAAVRKEAEIAVESLRMSKKTFEADALARILNPKNTFSDYSEITAEGYTFNAERAVFDLEAGRTFKVLKRLRTPEQLRELSMLWNGGRGKDIFRYAKVVEKAQIKKIVDTAVQMDIFSELDIELLQSRVSLDPIDFRAIRTLSDEEALEYIEEEDLLRRDTSNFSTEGIFEMLLKFKGDSPLMKQFFLRRQPYRQEYLELSQGGTLKHPLPRSSHVLNIADIEFSSLDDYDHLFIVDSAVLSYRAATHLRSRSCLEIDWGDTFFCLELNALCVALLSSMVTEVGSIIHKDPSQLGFRAKVSENPLRLQFPKPKSSQDYTLSNYFSIPHLLAFSGKVELLEWLLTEYQPITPLSMTDLYVIAVVLDDKEVLKILDKAGGPAIIRSQEQAVIDQLVHITALHSRESTIFDLVSKPGGLLSQFPRLDISMRVHERISFWEAQVAMSDDHSGPLVGSILREWGVSSCRCECCQKLHEAERIDRAIWALPGESYSSIWVNPNGQTTNTSMVYIDPMILR
ncbi:hypothetical protein ABW19_dt0203293 [Dactylella cylindrospora]|nr:hypothetical protein ABW19_dt0203293 [Dactylella cylindrospora]